VNHLWKCFLLLYVLISCSGLAGFMGPDESQLKNLYWLLFLTVVVCF